MSKRIALQNLCSNFKNLQVHNGPSTSKDHSKPRTVTPPTPTKIKNLFNIIHSGPKIVTCRNLHPTESKYQKILDLITNKNIVVENIVEVDNPFLRNAYKLKKEQKKKQFGEVHESLVFHGTTKTKADNICTYNFDWRLYGSNKGHKYGKGVSFSTNAKYASNYSDPKEYNKVMVVAKVLIADVCQGNENMELPPDGFDTSQKGNDGVVLVKYEDNEFYPAYKLYYHIEEDDDVEYWGEDDYDYNNDYDYDFDYEDVNAYDPDYYDYDYDYEDVDAYDYD